MTGTVGVDNEALKARIEEALGVGWTASGFKVGLQGESVVIEGTITATVPEGKNGIAHLTERILQRNPPGPPRPPWPDPCDEELCG